MVDPISALSLAAASWALNKARGVAEDTIIDQKLQEKFDQGAGRIKALIKEKLGKDKPSPATNHDLQRALAVAVCKATDITVRVPLREKIQTPEFREEERRELTRFLDNLTEYLNSIRVAALKRSTEFDNGFENELVADIVIAAADNDLNDGKSEELTKRITYSFKNKLIEREGGGLPEAVNVELDQKIGGGSLFGTVVLDEYLELLKSDEYPEAAKAFEYMQFSTIRQEINTLRDELGDVFAKILDALEDSFDHLNVALLRLQSSADAQSELLAKIDNRQSRWVTLVLSTKKVAPHESAMSYYRMTFESRRTRFIGREEELARLKRFVTYDTGPLVQWWQISGDGGQGKSRLALQLVDELSPSWHKGFLSASDLVKTDWRSLEFHRDTLIVVDYIAAPDKAAAFGEALSSLHERLKFDHGQTTLPIQHKVRFLILERTGFASDDANKSKSLLTWIDPLRRTPAKLSAQLDELVYDKKGALALGDLSQSDLINICNSWRDSLGNPPLTSEQIKSIIAVIGGDDSKRDRAWRPLLAMLCASEIDDRSLVSFERMDILKILEKAFWEEQNTYWKDDGKSIEPSDRVVNVACLTCMVGELKCEDHVDLLRSDIGESFYHIHDSTIGTIWMVLGQRYSFEQQPSGIPAFQARQPDLLSEYLLIWALENSVSGDFLNQDGPERIEKLMRDAWLIDEEASLAFLIRMREDFKHHAVTKKLINVPESISSDPALSWASYYGFNRVVIRRLEDNSAWPKSELDISLLMAAQEGHTEIVSALLDKGAEPNQIDHVDGGFPLLQAAQEGHTEIVSALLDKGAEPNEVNESSGAFALLAAGHFGRTEIAKILIESKADVAKTHEPSGMNSADAAEASGHHDLAKVIRRYM